MHNLYSIGRAVASIVAAGGLAFGCSSSSSGSPTPAPDSGSDGSLDGAVACMSPLLNAFDGGPTLSALESACSTQFANCAADCTCNNDYLGLFGCTAAPSADEAACFSMYVAKDVAVPSVGALLGCLEANQPVPDAGSDAATDGSSSDGSTTDGSSDGGPTDGGDGG
jgi:hypothetical protein